MSFVAALAVHDALRDLCGPALNLSLKWPNDVLLNGGKLSGILLESSGAGGQVAVLAIGIGVNLAQAPEPSEVEARAARLGETITARTGTAEITGRFDGIDETGALILTGPRGRQAISAADIHFGG